jgi:hypothetical protein
VSFIPDPVAKGAFATVPGMLFVPDLRTNGTFATIPLVAKQTIHPAHPVLSYRLTIIYLDEVAD